MAAVARSRCSGNPGVDRSAGAGTSLGATRRVIVVRRNGQTTVITGWRAWLLSLGRDVREIREWTGQQEQARRWVLPDALSSSGVMAKPQSSLVGAHGCCRSVEMFGKSGSGPVSRSRHVVGCYQTRYRRQA